MDHDRLPDSPRQRAAALAEALDQFKFKRPGLTDQQIGDGIYWVSKGFHENPVPLARERALERRKPPVSERDEGLW